MTTFSTFVNFKFASSFEMLSSVRLAWCSSIQCRNRCFRTRTDLFENLAEIGTISLNKQRSSTSSSLFCNSSNSEWKVWRRDSAPEESILVIARTAGLLINSDLYNFNSWRRGKYYDIKLFNVMRQFVRSRQLTKDFNINYTYILNRSNVHLQS